jgi:hypothetical protein
MIDLYNTIDELTNNHLNRYRELREKSNNGTLIKSEKDELDEIVKYLFMKYVGIC